MATIIDPGSTVTTKLRLFCHQQELAIGTGFFVSADQKIYVVIAWHNVAGRNAESHQLLSSHGGIPDRMRVLVGCRGHLGEWDEVDVPLYQDADAFAPRWLEHAVHGSKVDVVAVPFEVPGWADIRTISIVNTAPRMLLRVSMEVFVLGYPRGIDGGRGFPIWKRASIATEPDIDLDGTPKLLIDCATREGMSGAPVIAVAHGGFEPEPGFVATSNHAYRFVGIYSGRLGTDEIKAQLGIVWKSRVVNEILSGVEAG